MNKILTPSQSRSLGFQATKPQLYFYSARRPLALPALCFPGIPASCVTKINQCINQFKVYIWRWRRQKGNEHEQKYLRPPQSSSLGFQATKPQLYFYSARRPLALPALFSRYPGIPASCVRDDKINQCKVDDDGLTQRKMNKMLTLSIPQTTNPSRCPGIPLWDGWQK